MDRYEEALAKARAGKSLEEIFPEMKESEDERIYNEIMEFFRMNEKRCIVDNSYTKWIAWLEKQKEQTEELSTRLNGLMQEYVKAGKDEEEQEHRLKCYQLFWDALDDSEFFEQQEQKPANYDEYCMLIDGAREEGKIAGRKEVLDNPKEYRLQKWQKPAECIPDSVKFEEGFKTGRELGFREGVESVKNVEWSEKHIADIFEKVGLAKIVREQGNDELTNALQDAMLELSKVGNAEWSEEDEKMRQRIIRHIESEYQDWCKDKYGNSEIISDGKESCRERIAWLKSLRPQPHWKPSMKQMRYLFAVINDPNNIGAESCYLTIKSLYNDLKKL